MTTVDARLRELVAQHGVPERAVAAWRALLELLAADPTAPTTVREPERAVDVHIADSLTGLAVVELRGAGRIADLGAGAGFPGLVLAAALPQARVALVESSARKCTFLERAIEAAGLANADVVHSRAEEWRAGLNVQDAVTARALAPLGVLCEYAAPLLRRPGGVLVAYKGVRDAAEEEAGARAADIVGLERGPVLAVEPFTGADHRNLHLYFKFRETPSRFPRRPGMASKRQL
jgi:16S rRNA (guanine527-N7)-methyltransferase